MPPRQFWLFRFGCWVAFGTAVIHLGGAVLWPIPAAAPDPAALGAATSVSVVFPDGTARTLGDLLVGFSLAYALFLAAIGAIGLSAARRGRDQAGLMADVARVLAVACLGLLAISLTHFFLVPTFLVAVILVCFTLAAVRAPVGH